MKKLIFALTALVLMFSCQTKNDTTMPGIIFGIHEIVSVSDLPGSLISGLSANQIIIEEDPSGPFVGYLTATDTTDLLSRFSIDSIRRGDLYYAHRSGRDKKRHGCYSLY
jgi:hypothetical protein